MSLTGRGLLLLLVLLGVLLFAVVVSGWPRGGRAGRVVLRALPVIALNGVVVLLVLCVLNDQYLFYTSWSDLVGARQTRAVSQHGGSAAASQVALAHGPGLAHVAGARDYALPQPGQRLQQYSVLDPATGRDLPVLVDLPVGYDAASRHAYPVVLGLHGFPSVPMSWVRQNFLHVADTLVASRRLGPAIVVIPQIDDPRGLDTECVNGPPGDPQTETWLSQVVPTWAVRHLHVRTQRSAWVTFGYSYGGWCAATLTMRHPDVFGAAVVFEGYFAPDFLAGYDPFRPRQLTPYDLVTMARTAPPPVAMWVFASRQDTLSYPTTSRFVAGARAPLSVTATFVQSGGHRPSVYDPYTRDAWLWLARTMPAFRA
jgi:enterochelin esterase-like enzyme